MLDWEEVQLMSQIIHDVIKDVFSFPEYSFSFDGDAIVLLGIRHDGPTNTRTDLGNWLVSDQKPGDNWFLVKRFNPALAVFSTVPFTV